MIDCGDTVHHAPSDETWVVAFVDGNRLLWCGWPPGYASLTDCTLIEKASPEARAQLIRQMAGMSRDDERRRWARRQPEWSTHAEQQ